MDNSLEEEAQANRFGERFLRLTRGVWGDLSTTTGLPPAPRGISVPFRTVSAWFSRIQFESPVSWPATAFSEAWWCDYTP